MPKLVALDGGPLGLLTHPQKTLAHETCKKWLENLVTNRVTIILPAIVDYELRRDYIRRRNFQSLRRLNDLPNLITYSYLEDFDLRLAAELWAQMRQTGQPTAAPQALDVDCLLVAQVRREVAARNLAPDEWIIATSDIGDLNRLAPAAIWPEIQPN